MPSNNLNNSDVNTLISFFKRSSGFQHANRFKVDISPPSGVATPPPLFATMVQIPGQSVQYYSSVVGPSENNVDLPLKREYDNRFIVDFIVDKSWNCRSFFENWINSMFGTVGGAANNRTYASTTRSARVNYYDNVVGNMLITPLDTGDNVNKTIQMFGVWPAAILPTQMMNDTPNTYLTLTVDLIYRYYNIY